MKSSRFWSPAKGVTYVLGSEAPVSVQREALAAYVHRFTGEHKPAWTCTPWKEGKPYPPQFKDDADWLAHTQIPVKAGRLALGDCYSTPTWPDNPELRKDSRSYLQAEQRT